MYKVTIINGSTRTVIHNPNFNGLKLIDPEIKEGINEADGFNFTMLPDNPGYTLIRDFKTLIEVLDTLENKLIFEGRVYASNESMSEDGSFVKKVNCESELGYLNDSAQRHGEYRNMTPREFFSVIVANHNADIAHDEIDKTFRVGNVTVTNSTDNVYRYLGYEDTFSTIEDKLISRLGGELRVRKENGIRYLDYQESYGDVKETEIRLAKNLKSISKEADPSEIITRLIPLGERIESDDPDAVDASEARLTIESANDGRDYIEDQEAMAVYGVIAKSHVWDDITIPSILMTRGQQFIKANNRVKTKYIINALDLKPLGLTVDSFETGNYYPVFNPVMGINETLRVIGRTINLNDPTSNSLTIGDRFLTASQYQSESNKQNNRIVNLQSTIDSQRRTISTIRNEVKTVELNMDNIQQIIDSSDLPELSGAINELRKTVEELNEAIESIPTYLPATYEKDGLMSAIDKLAHDEMKAKLDLITVLNNVNLDELKEKLDLLLVTQPIDLDQLYLDVQNLKGSVT